MTTDLGMPGLPVQPVAERRKSRQIMVGKGKHAVPVGGDAPVSVQSMTSVPLSLGSAMSRRMTS